ncbi:MAG: 2-polyprenyl-3-methyl-6-methoxy-1,4-benzoquinone monooxygenase [Gammaproteobacteria bacterium]|nr:MAG: 2-polyprenyl-3-methyl-6-methoxy-1,4-benzoquinone monooxygenase [Gammaproteobacteria bacterium]
MTIRSYSLADRILMGLDEALRTVCAPASAQRPAPGPADSSDAKLDAGSQAEAARLMRVNHAGEVAAQALYRGHALSAGKPELRAHMERAAAEENDHLAWCEQRVRELGGRTSALNPVWYAGSFAIGLVSGLAGDKWSLGFVVETERQVVRHLDNHIARLPQEDGRSRAILEAMRADEAMHATQAVEAGAAELPQPVKRLMALSAGVMTGTAYWL